MPQMDGTGPEKQGPKTGRELGNCITDKNRKLLGKGMGKRFNSGGGLGFGRRLKYNTTKEI